MTHIVYACNGSYKQDFVTRGVLNIAYLYNSQYNREKDTHVEHSHHETKHITSVLLLLFDSMRYPVERMYPEPC